MISVVIPTRNPGADLEPLLSALSSEKQRLSFELVIVDSGSTDGSAEVLSSAADVFVEIPPATFDHGDTRNLGIESSSGDIVVLLVQDAVPEPGFLEAFSEAFADNPRIAGAFARQRPWPQTSRLSRRMLGRWIASSKEGRVVSLTEQVFAELSPADRLDRCAFDDVASCIRRKAWIEHPFQRVAIAEDLEWSRRVLLAGWQIAFVPESVVTHAHDRGPVYEFARTRSLHRELVRLFGLTTIPDRRSLLRAWIWTLGDHLEALRSGDGPAPGVSELLRVLSLAIAWPLGQYLGGRDAALDGGELSV